MVEVIASSTLANGLLSDFRDTYNGVRNNQSDGRLAIVMDTKSASNRQHEYAYYKAAPHPRLWIRGEPIPVDAMSSVRFTAIVRNWGLRIPWHEDDKNDDQIQALFASAQGGGENFGLLQERFFFDLITGNTTTLPAIPNAPDGAALYSATDGSGAARFGATGGNIVSGAVITSTGSILANYYTAIARFQLFEDGKDQPLFPAERLSMGTLVLHSVADLKIFEESFKQLRQGVLMASDAAATPSNIILDSSRNVDLWASPRLATGDWYIFMKNPPVRPTFLLERMAIRERTALSDNNNSDHARTYNEEYAQWDSREGAGIALPYATIKCDVA
jgi:hypothetical protein